MPGKKRVAVVRISRQFLNQANSNERQEETEPDSSTTQFNSQPLPEHDSSPIQLKPEHDPFTIQVKPRPIPEHDSPTIQEKPRPHPEHDPSPIHIKTRIHPESDPSPNHMKSRSYPEPVKTPPKKKEYKVTHRSKKNVFTHDRPETADSKSDDLNFQTVSSPQLTPIIQQQPTQTHTWIKPTSVNVVRPELNWAGRNQWIHNLWAVTEDCNMCCYACSCWCCFRHELSTMMGEHWCLWYINIVPLSHLRTKFRQQYAIEGSLAEDCVAATCCPLCVAVQLANEGREYGHRIFS